MSEIWAPVPSFEGRYSVSNLGLVRSEARTAKLHGEAVRPVRERILRTSRHSHGYLMVRLERKLYYVHHLVAMVFIGPRPPGFDVCHNDGNPANARADNLRYDTRSANISDTALHGTMRRRRGADHHNAKLTESDIIAIRADHRSSRTIAAELGVDHKTVHSARARMTWKHVI